MRDPGSRLDLSRPRDLGPLLADTLGIYVRHFGQWALIAAAVVIPVQVIVSGIGLEQITAGYDDSPSPAETFVPLGVAYLVTAPLLTAMAVHALLRAAEGEPPRAGPSISAGLDAFTPIFLAIVLAAAGITLGLFLFVAPGIYLAIRWYFVAQSVVIDNRRGADALARSSELVRGSWWRVFGIAIVITLVATLPAAILQIPLTLAAEAADRAVFLLAGSILGQIVSGPFVAIASTLLYFDLAGRISARAREPVPPPPPGGPGTPPDPPGLPPREP